MNKTDALKRSIEIAVERGWKGIYNDRLAYNLIVNIPRKYGVNTANELIVRGLILHPDFAKALFGEEPTCLHGVEMRGNDSLCNCGWEGGIKMPAWQYHLTKMVLYEDPLDYLVEYLEGREKK